MIRHLFCSVAMLLYSILIKKCLNEIFGSIVGVVTSSQVRTADMLVLLVQGFWRAFIRSFEKIGELVPAVLVTITKSEDGRTDR